MLVTICGFIVLAFVVLEAFIRIVTVIIIKMIEKRMSKFYWCEACRAYHTKRFKEMTQEEHMEIFMKNINRKINNEDN